MKKQETLESIGRLAVKYFTRWHPERWVGEGTPGCVESKEIRLICDRYKRSLKPKCATQRKRARK